MCKKQMLTALMLGISGLMLSSSALADIKLGALFPLSGGLALLGEESARGVDLAVQERNQSGGINNEQIILIRGDAMDNNQAVGEARRLISVEDVKAIFGTYSSAYSLAASQVAELAEIPYFELVAVSDDITNRGLKYAFRSNPSSSDFGGSAIHTIVDLIAPTLDVAPDSLKIAIIHEDSVFGSSVSDAQVKTAKDLGLNVVLKLPYSASTMDMSSIIMRLQQADVDVVLQTSYEKDSILFMKQVEEVGYAPKAIVGAGGGYILQPVADAVGHDNIEGTMVVAEAHFDINPDAAPGLEKFIEAYKLKFGSEPRSSHSLTSYVGAKAILDAMSHAKSMDSDDIISAVYDLDIPNGQTAVGWGVKFNEKGQNERAQMLVMQWQDGNLVTVYPESAAVGKFKLPN